MSVETDDPLDLMKRLRMLRWQHRSVRHVSENEAPEPTEPVLRPSGSVEKATVEPVFPAPAAG